ncbi:MAG: hypothetical protein J6X85_04555 [Ruminococcus sp.]|nr:hypothetical protein [Ruminococcus sp.]
MSFVTIVGIFLSGFVPAYFAKQIIMLITDLIFAPLFLMRVKTVSVFGLTFFMEEEKWKISFIKPEPMIQHEVRHDSRKVIEGSNAKNCLYLHLVQLAALIIAAAALCFVFRGLFFKSDKSVFEYLAVGSACGIIFQVLWRIHVIVCTHLIYMKRTGGYLDSLLERIRNGETFTQLDLKPLEQSGFKKITFLDRKIYYPIYMCYLAETGNTQAMHEPSAEMMEHFRDKEFTVNEVLAYYWLIYYFSAVVPNKENADILLEKLGNIIYDDNLANGKRVLAYYVFEHEHDLERAEQLVTDGFASLEAGNFSNAERILERSLLTQLNTLILNAKFNTYTGL